MSYSSTSENTSPIAAWLHAFSYSLGRSRFSVIVLVVGLGLLLSGQGRDVLLTYSEDRMTVGVAFAAAFWAFSIWGWSRLLLDVRYDEMPSCMKCYNKCRKWIPRLLGSSAFLIVAFSAYQTGLFTLVWWALGGFAIFLLLVTQRRPVERKLATQLSKSSHRSVNKIAKVLNKEDIDPDSIPPYKNFMEMLGVRVKKNGAIISGWKFRAIITLAMFLAFIVLAVLGNVAPVWLGTKTGTLILFFIWGATWLPIGSLMSYVADKRGIPLIFLLVIVALASSYINDNHEIRPANEGVPITTRPSVSTALEIWGKANPALNKEPVPFVVVATAGGGIRAAYWTVTVLGDMHDHADQFSQRAFALSGVSGGSVGATVYRALLDVPTAQFNENCSKGMKRCAQQILGQDFLGPLTAAMLYPDLAQRFFPFPIFPDRAAALEKSWEKSFLDITKQDTLNNSLSKLGSRAGAPSLFLNATWDDNGRRIVASNLRFAKVTEDDIEAYSFVLSNDELAVIGYDLRLSTAAHNSARFPVVSPPGMWKRDGEVAGRLQDGGLFENYGAITALEVLDLACRKFACPDASLEEKKRLQNIIPIVIMITSDPSLPENLAESRQDVKPVTFGYEFRSTLTAYESVRNGRGAEAAYNLQEWIDETSGKGNFYTFRMCKSNSAVGQPPLGWALSNAAKDKINNYLLENTASSKDDGLCYSSNAKNRQELIRRMTKKVT